MLDYHIEVHGDTAGKQCWCVTFRADENIDIENDTQIIDNIIRNITSSLRSLNTNSIEDNNKATWKVSPSLNPTPLCQALLDNNSI